MKRSNDMRQLAAVLFVCIFMLPSVMMVTGCTKPLTKQEVIGIDGKQFVVDVLPPKEVFEYIKKNKGNSNFVILDIRTPEEFRDGHLEGAVNVDFRSDNFGREIQKLDTNKTYLVYCRTGNRSYDAVSTMARIGFRSMIRLSGDITGWKSAGLPVVR